MMLLMQLAGAGVPHGSAEVGAFTAFSNLRVEPASHVILQQVTGAGVVVTVVPWELIQNCPRPYPLPSMMDGCPGCYSALADFRALVI